jgi:hypothetical protein
VDVEELTSRRMEEVDVSADGMKKSVVLKEEVMIKALTYMKRITDVSFGE